jgi:hypothetical protein
MASTSAARAENSRTSNTISITIRSLVENMIFNGTVSENKDDIRRQVEETLLRVLYAAQSAS